MRNQIIIVIAAIAFFVLGFLTTNEVQRTVIYTDKSFDKSGRVLFWVQTEGSSYLRQVCCPIKVGDTISLHSFSLASVFFFVLGLLCASYFAWLIRDEF